MPERSSAATSLKPQIALRSGLYQRGFAAARLSNIEAQAARAYFRSFFRLARWAPPSWSRTPSRLWTHASEHTSHIEAG